MKYQTMKTEYQKPDIRVYNIDTSSMICESGNVGGSLSGGNLAPSHEEPEE